jgi:hypothetical protein
MRWLAPALVALALLVAAFGTVLGAVLVPCHGELRALPEPASWRAWPVVPDGGYVVDGKLAHPRRPFYAEIHASAPDVCTDGILSLDQWLIGRDANDLSAMYHRPNQLSLRSDPGGSGVFVVAGKGDGATESTFVAAFRRDDSRWAYVSRRSQLLLVAVAVAIAALLGAAIRAFRSLWLERLVADRNRVREGVRDAAGNIRLVDSGAIVSPAPPGPPGPVLVRVGACAPGTYRKPPTARAMQIWSGHRDGVAMRSRDAAARGLRWAVALAAVLAPGIVGVGFVLGALDVLESLD